jgi:RNA polymerase sigma factor (sigma-70 family)
MTGAMGSVPTDALIIEQSVREPEVFRAVFDRHVDAVHGYLARRAGGDVADTLVGDVFRIAFEGRSRYQLDRECALPWLYGIAANVLRQHRRGERRKERLLTKLASAAPLDWDRDATDGVDARAHLAEVLAALDEVPEAEREAVLLYAWEDLSYEEVAAAQEVPVGTVRSRLNRARRRIRERIGGAGQEGDEPDPRGVGRSET